jgi:hypothetical protein
VAFRRLILFAAAAAVAAIGVACNSGSSATPSRTASSVPETKTPAAAVSAASGSVTATPTSGITITGTDAPTVTPTPFSDAQKTALAAGASASFSDYKDPDGHFTVGLPDGWTIQPTKGGVSATLAGSPATAQIGVFCAAGASVQTLHNVDSQTIEQTKQGTLPGLDAAVPTQVAGVDAQEIDWSGAYLNTPHKHWWIYMQSHDCAWRFILTTFPEADVSAMQQIFQKMLASFRFG